MKILHLIHTNQRRGAEIFAVQLSEIQQRYGHEVKIVSVYTGNDSLKTISKIETLSGSFNSRFYDIKAWYRLSRIIKKFDPDVIQANAGDTLKYAIFSKFFFFWKVPIVFRNASEIGRYLNSNLQKNYNSFLFKRTDYIISVSNASKKDIISRFPYLKERTVVIPIGLQNNTSIKKVYFEPKEAFHIIHVGGFTFEKNHEALIEIFEGLHRNNPNTYLHLIGDGPLRSSIETMVGNARLEKFVNFHGFIDNPLNYVSGANVLVLPSKIEGLPGVILEAMFCKTPVVAYNVGGISEIVNSKTGFLVSKDDVEEFKNAIVKVLEAFPKQKVSVAYDMVTSNFMNENIAKKFLQSYDTIIGKT
ncbi:glycosyltransferase [uncultured Christiangramia sp.]|uniref:glycosyltransferase n=1 Tax=Christiangramia sp. 3-2217-3z TaxID=3417564 RepID=UPI00260C99A8|nr:glycosyltransferase [uncultured Christiangramia sp.]